MSAPGAPHGESALTALMAQAAEAIEDGPSGAEAGAEAGALAVAGAAASLRLAGREVIALAEGALWLPGAEALLVSDLHFEKGSSYASGGQFLPPYDTRETLVRLGRLLTALKPRRVVALGDSFHDAGAEARLAREDAETLQAMTRAFAWLWVQGNHDPAPPRGLAGDVAEEARMDGFILRHEPRGEEGEIAGHLHPCARIAGKGRAVRTKCFATDGAALVLPAFGAYTGGLNLKDAAFAAVFRQPASAFMLWRGRIWPAHPTRLLPD